MFYTLFWKVWMAEFYLVLFFLLGDFNAEFLIMHQHLLFHKLSIVFVLKQVVPEPTHTNPSGSSTLINLALLSAPSQILNCNVVPPLSNSDHNGFTLGVYIRWNDPGQDTPLLSGACKATKHHSMSHTWLQIVIFPFSHTVWVQSEGVSWPGSKFKVHTMQY